MTNTKNTLTLTKDLNSYKTTIRRGLWKHGNKHIAISEMKDAFLQKCLNQCELYYNRINMKLHYLNEAAYAMQLEGIAVNEKYMHRKMDYYNQKSRCISAMYYQIHTEMCRRNLDPNYMGYKRQFDFLFSRTGKDFDFISLKLEHSKKCFEDISQDFSLQTS